MSKITNCNHALISRVYFIEAYGISMTKLNSRDSGSLKMKIYRKLEHKVQLQFNSLIRRRNKILFVHFVSENRTRIKIFFDLLSHLFSQLIGYRSRRPLPQCNLMSVINTASDNQIAKQSGELQIMQQSIC